MNKILAIIMVLTVFLYGCAGGSSGSNNSPSLGETITTVSILKEITESVSKSLTAEYTITYAMDFGEETTDVTIYHKGENFRTDATYEGVESRSYFVENAATMCTNQNSKWSCIQVTSEDDIVNPADTDLQVTEYEDELSSEEENPDFKIYRDGTMTVSGHNAKCYAFEYGTSVKERMCLSNEGVLLYHKFTDGNETSEFSAKSYSAKVDSNAFKLPEGAEIIDMNEQFNTMQAEYEDYEYDENSVYNVGACYEECDSQDLSEADLEECYMQCYSYIVKANGKK
jgi:hypothetical protein